MDNMYLMSRETSTVDDSMLKTYYKKAIELSSLWHRLDSFGTSGVFELDENRQLTVAEVGSKSSVIQVEEFSEPPVMARFIIRYRSRLDIVDDSNRYVCPKSLGATALETHIQMAAAVQDHFAAKLTPVY